MNSTILNILILFISFLSMEGVAWFTHKYVMHGFLWILHRDHHNKDISSFFEHNDFFFLLFAIPGILGLLLGIQNNFNHLFWIGLGITLYGFTYFLVHDIFIHQRFNLLRNSNNKYLLSLRRAHKAHHKYLGKHDGECFGMLLFPKKYYRN